MARTRKDQYGDDSIREAESDAHKTRREQRKIFHEITRTEDWADLEDDEFETFEPIKPKRPKK